MVERRLNIRLDPATEYYLRELHRRLNVKQADLVRQALAELAQRKRIAVYTPPVEQERPRVVELAATPALGVYLDRETGLPTVRGTPQPAPGELGRSHTLELAQD